MASTTYRHLSMAELEAGLAELSLSPRDHGKLEMIVCRPAIGERLVVERGELDRVNGLIRDNWKTRGSKNTEDGSAHPEMQVVLMNSRIIQLIAQDRSRWPMAGDQLFVDLDLSVDNLQPGDRLAIGSAVLEITSYPHNGCAKFTERFGQDAIRWVNSPEGKAARRRGIYARVVQAGTIAAGDTITKIPGTSEAR